MTKEEGGATMMGHTTINNGWELRFAQFGWISDNSLLQKQWFVADDDDAAVSWGRLACAPFALLLLEAAPNCLAHGIACDVRF